MAVWITSISAVLILAVTQGLVTISAVAGFFVGSAALWFVHRDVVDMGHEIDRQGERLDAIERIIQRMEGRKGEPQ